LQSFLHKTTSCAKINLVLGKVFLPFMLCCLWMTIFIHVAFF